MTTSGPTDPQDGLLERVRAGDARALARAISMVEDGRPGAVELLAACRKFAGKGLRIGLTGPPGAGKSTLVDGLVRAFRAAGQRVAVLAIDPSSPYTGGALLGDRIRMQGFAADEGVYLRSMASRGAVGGLAAAAAGACALMESAGHEVILIETVGVGQDEVAIAAIADVTLVVLVPGLGDDVQSLKAGVLEIADIFVVNKADLPGADRVEAELQEMQSLAAHHAAWVPPIMRTTATSGEGVDSLVDTIRRFHVAVPRARADGPAAARLPETETVLDHLGIAVRSIAAAGAAYAKLGLAVSREETVEHEQVRIAMLPLAGTRIELLEATSADSTIGRFLARRGEGLHHIALRRPDVNALFAQLREQGVRLASDCIRTGAGGHRYFFIHPESTGGVLIEIVGDGE